MQLRGQSDSAVTLLKHAVALIDDDPAIMDRLSKLIALSEMLRFANRQREGTAIQQRVLRELELAGYGDTELLPNMVSFLYQSLAELGEFRMADSILADLIHQRETTSGQRPVPQLLAFLHGRNKLSLGDIDSADVWITRASQRPWPEGGTQATWTPSVAAQIGLAQQRLSDARTAASQLPSGRPGQRATAAFVRALLSRASGDTAAASQLLERELAAIYAESPATQSRFTIPLVTAGEWRLAAGDARGADSLARLGWAAAVTDSIAPARSALAGRATLLRAQAMQQFGDSVAAGAQARLALSALANGYGASNRWTQTARALLGTLPH